MAGAAECVVRMSGLPREYLELQKRIERDKLELERVREELKAIGSSLKRDYIREVLEPRAAESFSPDKTVAWNRMCRKCFNICKQPETVKIYQCARYEPLE